MNPASSTCPLCQHDAIIEMECIACDADQADKTVSVRTCPACDFAWQWPLERTVEQSNAFFQHAYENKREASYFDTHLRSQISNLQLGFLNELDIEEKTLLDIGCGDGNFATEAAKNGWTALGLDPAIPPEKEQQTTLAHLKLTSASLEHLPPDEKFMCVTMWDVVEHLPDPEPMLKNAWDRVAVGGWLILETGNYQSAERLLCGRGWWAWQLDHRWYFAPPTLLQFLKSFDYSESRLADRVFRPWSAKKPTFRAPSFFQTSLSIAKRPWRISAILSEHGAKRQAAAKWPKWAGLPIFTLAIRK